MAICPKCKEEIEHLIFIESGYMRYTCYYGKDMLEYEQKEFEPDDNVMMFLCPKCNSELFNSPDEAEDFLKYKDKLAKLIADKLKKNGK